MRRALTILLFLLLFGIGAAGLGVLCGSGGCGVAPQAMEMLWLLRLPRVLSAFAVGALLALAGTLMQLLLRNPLADPYVLGVSGGAAAGAMGLLLAVPAAWSAWALHLGALLGALLATGLLFGLARRALLRVTPALAATTGVRLILTGVMIAAGFGALLTLIMSVTPDTRLRGMLFWLMGDLDNSLLYAPAWAVLALTLAWAVANAARLNVLAHGDVTAQLLGVPVVRLRAMALLAASLATAGAVAVAGAVGFVGLVVPHALRLVVGNDQRILLPGAALAGGAVLTLADLVARTVAAPVQLPVGVVTALAGVPVFLFLLSRSRV